MSKIKVLVVEDEWIVSEELKVILINNGFEVTGQAESAKEALVSVAENTPDIVIADINIKGGMDGIELAVSLKKDHQLGVIFLTAYHDDYFIKRASKADPDSYFVKPFDERNLTVALEVAFEKLSQHRIGADQSSTEGYFLEDRVFVKDKNRYIKVSYEDLLFVEADGSYCIIHTLDASHTLAVNLKVFEEKVSFGKLMRVHRSFLVNIAHIDSIEGHQLQIQDYDIPVSQSHKGELMKKLNLI